jgi:general secretion pathway protein H
MNHVLRERRQAALMSQGTPEIKKPRGSGLADCDRGTSLIEVLVVMAILVLVAVVALPSQRGPRPVYSLAAVATDLAARLRAARATALSENRDVVFSYDAETRTYVVEGTGPPQRLPPETDLSITTARQFVRDAQEARLLFFADGTSSGGTIKLAHAQQSITISIAWLTSVIEVSSGPP